MLAVEKEMLQAQTAKEVVELRSMELQYYVEHIGSIQTVATLLAGFAFTAFLSMDSLAVSEDSLLWRSQNGDYTGSISDNGTQITIGPTISSDWTLYYAFAFKTLQSITVCLCLCEMLYVVMETLISRQLGTRLALRGPEGSIIRATQFMAMSLTRSTRHFVFGLQYFMLSVVCHAIRNLHPGTSTLVTLVIGVYWWSQWGLVERLAERFELREATSTAFGGLGTSVSGGLGGTPSPRARRDEVDDTAGHGGNLVLEDHKLPSVATTNLIARVERKQEQGVRRVSQASGSAPGAGEMLASPSDGQELKVVTVAVDLESAVASSPQKAHPSDGAASPSALVRQNSSSIWSKVWSRVTGVPLQ